MWVMVWDVGWKMWGVGSSLWGVFFGVGYKMWVGGCEVVDVGWRL